MTRTDKADDSVETFRLRGDALREIERLVDEVTLSNARGHLDKISSIAYRALHGYAKDEQTAQ